MTISENDVRKMSFEDAIKELEAIVDKLDNGNVPLDEALSLFKMGVILSEHCNSRLEEANGVIRLLIRDRSGELSEVPFATDEEENV